MLERNPLISIIVPVYNVEQYLDNCFQSLVNQSYASCEIILVDDESTDSSGRMCDDFASKYDNVKVIHQKNGGQSSARRTGFEVSEGEWITFVDSDDSLLPDALNTLYRASGDFTDIVIGFAFESVDPQHVIPIVEWRKALIKSDSILCTPWGKLFRRSIMRPEHFELITSNRTASDMPMNIKISYATEKPVVVVHPQIYNYNLRNDSLSKTAKWSITKISDLYSDVLHSVPEPMRDEAMPQLIENRLIALNRKMLESPMFGREEISSLDYVRNLNADIRSCSYPLSCQEKMLVKHPDSIFTIAFIKIKHFILRLIQFVKRCI